MNTTDIYALIAREYYARKEASRNNMIVRQPKVGEHELVVKPHFETNLNRRSNYSEPLEF